ncbi:MAG: hypothetical protein IPJ88_10055 [Myxococcales bacterium]|nr:MAG: hypothetical protein IPJ88_10055 [Myxococcales bacterium]
MKTHLCNFRDILITIAAASVLSVVTLPQLAYADTVEFITDPFSFHELVLLNSLGEMGTGPMVAEFGESNVDYSVIAEDQYQSSGMTLHFNTTSVTPDIGASYTECLRVDPAGSYILDNDGIAQGMVAVNCGVAVFDPPVHRFGLVAGLYTGVPTTTKYLSVWNSNDELIAQINWTTVNQDSHGRFLGIAACNTDIKMIAFGNDDIWNGTSYDVSGTATSSDHWVWSSATINCGTETPDPIVDAGSPSDADVLQDAEADSDAATTPSTSTPKSGCSCSTTTGQVFVFQLPAIVLWLLVLSWLVRRKNGMNF